MKVFAVIPARYDSSRFPGKALTDLAGKPLIQRVYEQVGLCEGIDDVLIATDDERILSAAISFGANAVMTSASCTSGTDRVAQAVKNIEADAIINIQGDQVQFDSDALSAMIAELRAGQAMTTIATPAAVDELADPNCVKVVCDQRGYALYFSRAPIPFVQKNRQLQPLKHIGIYGFSRETLFEFTNLEPSPLELTESLEQLRALENGIPIKVVVAKGEFFEINTPDDKDRLLKCWPG